MNKKHMKQELKFFHLDNYDGYKACFEVLAQFLREDCYIVRDQCKSLPESGRSVTVLRLNRKIK